MTTDSDSIDPDAYEVLIWGSCNSEWNYFFISDYKNFKDKEKRRKKRKSSRE
jgi:hypothetical protein